MRPECLEALKEDAPYEVEYIGLSNFRVAGNESPGYVGKIATKVRMTMPGTEGGALDNLMVPIATITVDLIGTYAYPAGYVLSYW